MNQHSLTVTQLRRLRKSTYRVPLHVSPDGAALAVSVTRDEPGAEVRTRKASRLRGSLTRAVGSRVLVVNTATATEEPFSAARTSWGGQWSPDGTMLAAYVQQQQKPPGLASGTATRAPYGSCRSRCVRSSASRCRAGPRTAAA